MGLFRRPIALADRRHRLQRCAPLELLHLLTLFIEAGRRHNCSAVVPPSRTASVTFSSAPLSEPSKPEAWLAFSKH